MTTFRFRDGMGETLTERDFPDASSALAWAAEEDELDEDVQRVEYRGPEGDWRWAGPSRAEPAPSDQTS